MNALTAYIGSSILFTRLLSNSYIACFVRSAVVTCASLAPILFYLIPHVLSFLKTISHTKQEQFFFPSSMVPTTTATSILTRTKMIGSKCSHQCDFSPTPGNRPYFRYRHLCTPVESDGIKTMLRGI